jgi:hypothetical protein
LYDGYRRTIKTRFSKNYRRFRVLDDGGERGEGGGEEQLSRLTVGQDLPHVLQPSLHHQKRFWDSAVNLCAIKVINTMTSLLS